MLWPNGLFDGVGPDPSHDQVTSGEVSHRVNLHRYEPVYLGVQPRAEALHLRSPGSPPAEARSVTVPETSGEAHPAPTIEAGLTRFDDFFTDEYPRLVTVLTALTGNKVLAEDIAQEAMVRAHQRWERVSRYDIPAAWVRRVAINLASNGRARRRSEKRALARLAGERPTWEVQMGRDDGPDDFWSTVRRLPARQAAAIALHYLEDRPVAEVAEILGCAEGTAKVHLHKGRHNLAKMLDLPEEAP